MYFKRSMLSPLPDIPPPPGHFAPKTFPPGHFPPKTFLPGHVPPPQTNTIYINYILQ